MFCDVNFMYGLYHDCARTLKRSFAGKLALVQLSSGFSFARNSSRAPCALASFSRARIPRSACTRDVTCELYCKLPLLPQHGLSDRSWKSFFYYTKINCRTFTKVRFSLIFLFSHNLFITTKRQHSDVEPSFIPIFRLFQSMAYVPCKCS